MNRIKFSDLVSALADTPVDKYTQIDQTFTVEDLMIKYYAVVYRLALSILNDPDEAEDAAQDVFVTVNIHLSQFRGEAKPKTWLYAITINRCRTMLRKRKVQAAMQAAYRAIRSLGQQSALPEEITLKRVTDEEIWAAVDCLSEKHRIPVILRYRHELSIPEIAETLGLRPGTVHSRLHYARAKLQGQLLRNKAGLKNHDEV